MRKFLGSGALLGALAIMVSGCGATGAMSAAGQAALRAAGLTPADARDVRAEGDESLAQQTGSHWSETWVWVGDPDGV